MSEKDQKDLPKTDDAPDDGDIDDLSQTEKAAFEKIMAQISEADGEDINNTAESKQKEPAGDQNQPLDTTDEDGATLSSESKEDADNTGKEVKNEDDLSDDQRQALDQIMSEIAGEDKKPSEAPVDGKDGDDQQDALDQVLAEIETEESAPVDDDTADDETLSDDQQAALDQIMAEIKGDEQEDTEIVADDGPTNVDPGSETDKPASAQEQVTETDVNKASPPKDEASDGLSMEEFDDELSSLLGPSSSEASEAKKDSSDAVAKAPHPASSDQSLEDINSALKNIVKTSDNKENQSEPASQTDNTHKKAESSTGVLKEVDAKPTPAKKGSRTQSKTALWSGSITVMASLIAISAYWGYRHYLMPGTDAGITAVVSEAPAEHETSLPDDHINQRPPIEALPVTETTNATTIQPGPFEALRDDIVTTRNYIQQKKEEILELKRYYQNGIQEERNKVLTHQTQPPLSFKAALENRAIELGLRSIQRRATYNLKLETPLAQVETHLEQLLYLERRIRLFELLDNTISGLSLADLKRDGADLINKLRKESEQLSVENVEAVPPSLKSIWQELSLGEKSGHGPDTAITHATPQNQKISNAICKGNFELKYLLTALTPQTAKCLANWPGKDLYLNGLTHLSPEVAKQLGQWPGEWLSLNGIKHLSPEAARHLSKWPGKRLSLNGVATLSDEATTYLAQWQGEQLEMIGLTAIGRWENYVTHLFLSERLRRKLQVK